MASYDKIKEVAQEMNIVSGALHPKCIYLIAENDYDPKIHGSEYNEWDYPFKFHLYLYAPEGDNKGDEWSGKRYLGLKGMTKVVSLAKEPIDFLGCLHDGNVITHKNAETGADGVQWDEKVIPTDFPITDTATIGQHIYALSSSSQIFKRMTDTQWEAVHQPVKKTHKGKAASAGFFCLAGFSADEFYAGGDDGVLWLCEQGNWHSVEIPYHQDIEQIICAPDGYVYLNCRWKILKGRKENWELIEIEENLVTETVEKIVWFKDELYILPDSASITGMYKIHNNSITACASNVSMPSGTNDMVANDELLMITGNEAVILFNGERWFNLFDKNKTEEELRATGTFYDPREL